MKLNVYLFSTLFAFFLLLSCKKDTGYWNDFSRSEKDWRSFKASSGNSYRYMVTTGSWTGATSETVVNVEKGQVVGRSYVRKMRDYPDTLLVIRDQWEEDVSSLGSHEQGAEPVTLDEIYLRAKNDWLKKRDNAKTYFETQNSGMISLCGYVNDGCMDDCFIGITIKYIEAL